MARVTRDRRSRRLATVLTAVAALLGLALQTATPAGAQGAQVLGSGSTYAAIAIRQWTAQAQSLGLQVNYTPSGSPTGLSQFAGGQADFAGTEAEYASVNTAAPARGYQYVPDVAGATAIMYNLKEKTGQKVDYLHLTPQTIARIYIGKITSWSDPAISASNKGIAFPDAAINVVHRGGDSGTTALFYDFVATVLGGEYTSWYSANCSGGRPDVRPVNVVNICAKGLGKTTSFNDSEQIAQFVANNDIGANSIAFDEFGYARKFQVPTAWVQNAGGSYVLPYAENISAALEGAKLRPDLSQELSGVYGSANPKAYPISAYSYLVTQCAPSGERPTCAGAYSDPGKTQTLGAWMRYIACDGQVSMAQLGYSPLPPNLSQEMANSISRLTGQPAEKLGANTCSNPRFAGSLGSGASSPCDPFLCGNKAGGSSGGAGGGAAAGGGVAGRSGSAGGPAGAAGSGSGSGAPVGTGSGSASGAGAVGTGAPGASAAPEAAGVGVAGGDAAAANGGTGAGTYRDVSPQALDAGGPPQPLGGWPVAVVITALAVPLLLIGGRRFLRARRG